MAKKPAGKSAYQKKLSNIAKRAIEAQKVKAPVPMSGVPADFTNMPTYDLSSEAVEEAYHRAQERPPSPRVHSSFDPKRAEAAKQKWMKEWADMAQRQQKEATKLGMKPQLFTEGLQSALPPAEAYQPPPKAAMTPSQAKVADMAAKWKHIPTPQGTMARSMTPQARRGLIMQLMKKLGLAGGKKAAIGAIGGPVGMMAGGLMEAAEAAPVGVGQGMYGGIPGGELAGQVSPEDMARGQEMARLAAQGYPAGSQVVAQAPPIRDWDYAAYAHVLNPQGEYPTLLLPRARPMTAGVMQEGPSVHMSAIPGMTKEQVKGEYDRASQYFDQNYRR